MIGGVARAAPVQPVSPHRDAQAQELDPLGLDSFDQDSFEMTVAPHDDFQSLDEIFGAAPEVVDRSARKSSPIFEAEDSSHRDSSDKDASDKDASSTLMRDLPLDDEFHSALDVFDAPLATAPPVSPPKIVRATSGNLPPTPHVMVTDVFDPFAAIESDQPEISPAGSELPVEQDDEFDAVIDFAVTPPEISEGSAASALTPKIVRGGDVGEVNERIIVPPSLAAANSAAARAPQAESFTVSQPKTRAYEFSREVEHMTEPRDQIYWKNESSLVGFLVTYDHDPKGTYVELRQGRLMVSNQREESGSCLVVVGESVSPMHAIMRVAPGGLVQVLDQLSEAGTRVKHLGNVDEEFLSGEKSSLSHGDIVFFGDRKFHVLLVVGEVGED
jgi:hypothetical protein